MLKSKNVNNDVTKNPPIQSQQMKTFHQTVRLVIDMNSAKNGDINCMKLFKKTYRMSFLELHGLKFW